MPEFDISDLKEGDVVNISTFPRIIDDVLLRRINNGEEKVEPIFLEDKVLHQVLGACGCVELDPYRWRLYLDKNDNEYTFWDWTIVKSFEKDKPCHDTVIRRCCYLHELQHAFQTLELVTDIKNGINQFLLLNAQREYYIKLNKNN